MYNTCKCGESDRFGSGLFMSAILYTVVWFIVFGMTSCTVSNIYKGGGSIGKGGKSIVVDSTRFCESVNGY